MILAKGAKAIIWSKDRLCNIHTGTSGHTHARTHTHRANLDTDVTHFTKINSKWVIDLEVKCKTMKFPEDNRRKPR